jgi:hypothetical protein
MSYPQSTASSVTEPDLPDTDEGLRATLRVVLALAADRRAAAEKAYSIGKLESDAAKALESSAEKIRHLLGEDVIAHPTGGEPSAEEHLNTWNGVDPFSSGPPSEPVPLYAVACWCNKTITPRPGGRWAHTDRDDESRAHLCYPDDPGSNATASPNVPRTGDMHVAPHGSDTRVLEDPMGVLPGRQEDAFRSFASRQDPDGDPVFGGDPLPPAGGGQQ